MGRSRTAWLTAFLTYGEWKCYHEVGQRLRHMKDIYDVLHMPNSGFLETAAIHARSLIKYACPQIREVVILRPLEQIIDSFLKMNTHGLVTWDEIKMRKIIGRGQHELQKLAKLPTVLALEFEELSTEEGCKKIFEYCLPYEFDKAWWELGKEQNIQLDTKEFFQYYVSNREAIETFKKQLKSDLRGLYAMGEIKKEMRAPNA